MNIIDLRKQAEALALILAVVSCAYGQKMATAGSTEDVVFFDFHPGLARRQPNLFSRHELIDGVIIGVEWSAVEPAAGRFNFDGLDRSIGTWAAAGKRVVLRVAPYGQAGGNNLTPAWVYDTVPVIPIESPKRGTVRIPKVWSPAFMKLYGTLIRALAERYDNDARVSRVQIGIGHIGFLTAQPSKEGERAFVKAGWTPEIWATYANGVTDLYAESFKKKRLVLAVTPLFLRRYYLSDNLATGRRIVEHAAGQGCAILFKGLCEDPDMFRATGFPALARGLAALPLPNPAIGFGDDWPLIGPAGRKTRTVDDFRSALANADRLWREVGGKGTVFLVLLDNELAATEKGNTAFDPAAYVALKGFVDKARERRTMSEAE